MYIQVLKSKLKQVTVTESSKEYEGSLILCPILIIAANLIPYERVEVNGVDKKERHTTYIIPGKPGDVIIAGGLAQYFDAGDKIHVNCFAFYDKSQEKILGKAVYTDRDNIVTDIKEL